MVLGIDKQADGYFLSATAVMPQEGQDGAVKRLSIGATGDSVSNALEEIMIKMIASSYDISDKKYIEPILECLNNN